ncbi:MAG: penicillin-binding protein 1A [Gammaproteobacteria bacterium]
MKLKTIRHWLWASLSLSLTACFTFGIAILYLQSQLPSVAALDKVQLQVPLRIYTNDNKLIAVFGEKRRIPLNYDQIPKQLIDAVLATEDQRFFDHSGIDIRGLARAAVELIRTGTKSQGGSTITMQVARNFFLSRKKTFLRKINEVLLAIKIDNTLSKEKILELYLNKIYFGNRAYGVAAAAQVYYGKPLQQLTLAQYAMLAGLPKAPSRLNPLVNQEAALARRNHVLSRMHENHLINDDTYSKTIAEPLTARYHNPKITVEAPYVAEMVRQQLYERFGEVVYTSGLQVHTTIDSKLQLAANRSLRDGLIAYDHRHGFRKPTTRLGINSSRQEQLAAQATLSSVNDLIPAVVTQVNPRSIQVLLSDGSEIQISWQGLRWAKPYINGHYTGSAPQSAHQIVRVGDVVRVLQRSKDNWELAQVPKVNGALIALNPHNGAIKALVGGFDFQHSKFNRITQAERQAGSAFKPFIYSAALAKGFTLASVINDAPVVMDDPSLENLWRPENDSRRFYGPTRLREGLIHSRNLVSIRLLQSIGIPFAIDYIHQFGFNKSQLPNSYSLALGSATVTPLQLVTGYSTFANGGYKISPFTIDRISNAVGKTIYLANPPIACSTCKESNGDNSIPEEQQAPAIITPQNAYLMSILLNDVIQHGTGHAAKQLHRKDIAGKTGTTNDKKDAWFVGFNSDLVTAVWVGFDKPDSIYEYGAQAALPIWIDFMRQALDGIAEHSPEEPEGLVSVRIDPRTGLRANAGQSDSFFEIFRQEHVPQRFAPSYSFSNQSGENNQSTPEQEHLF